MPVWTVETDRYADRADLVRAEARAGSEGEQPELLLELGERLPAVELEREEDTEREPPARVELGIGPELVRGVRCASSKLVVPPATNSGARFSMPRRIASYVNAGSSAEKRAKNGLGL